MRQHYNIATFKMIPSNTKHAFILKDTQLFKIFRNSHKPTHLCSNFKIQNVTSNFVTENKPSNHSFDVKSKVPADWSDIITGCYKKYQDFVGITEILEAQEKVTSLTNQLFSVQSKRRQLQKDVETMHQQLLATHQRITKSELYSEDHYSLFEKARELNSTLKNLQIQFLQTEEEERSLFTRLSTAIQFCHEKERTQSENSKYWSILISVISAALASLITSINNWVRIKEIKEHALSLHKDTMDKTDRLYTAIANVTGKVVEPINDSRTGLVVSETFVEAIKSTLREEVGQIVSTFKGNSFQKDLNDYLQSQEGSSPHTTRLSTQDVSYTRIVGSMLTGAIMGILITACFFGSAGGTG